MSVEAACGLNHMTVTAEVFSKIKNVSTSFFCVLAIEAATRGVL